MAGMAQALDIDTHRYNLDNPEDLAKLWAKISDAMAGGVAHPSDPIIGDPFAVFLTGICQNIAAHPSHLERRQTAVVKTGHRVDQAEAERILAYLKAQENVYTCDICQGRITTWQSDNTRVSTFAAQDRKRIQTFSDSSIIRGSDDLAGLKTGVGLHARKEPMKGTIPR